MEASKWLAILLFSVPALLVAYLVLRNTSRVKLPVPPGPKPLPILGNLFDIPTSHEYRTYAQWSKEYGDVVYVTVLGKHILILDSVDAAKELLDGRSSIYSDRPYLPMLHEPSLMDSNWSFAMKRYADEWRRQRRMFSKYLNPTASRAFVGTQTASAHGLLRSMLHRPERLALHLRHTAAEAILAITYGFRIQSNDDPFVALIEEAFALVSKGVLPGRFFVNFLPWMKYIPGWFPGAGFKSHAAKAREVERRSIEEPFEAAKRQIADGTASPSFVTNALTDPSPGCLIPDIKAIAGTMYGATTDTIVSTMHACILALVLNPAIQLRAQAELDTVLGSATSATFRLPTFADRPHLPYIDAIVKESLRWFPIVPIGIPHATTEEDVYRGWRIPKGTIVIANVWSMLRSEKTYSNPLTFRPERFLGEIPAPHPGIHGCFGFGRRECPGRHLGETLLWIQIASLLAAFTFSPAKDKDGRDIDINHAREPVPGFTLHPQDFPCKIIPRSREVELRIKETHLEGN